MTKYLILVRHSVPEIREDQPAHTWRLSEEGRLRAQGLAEHLRSFAPEALVSSTEPKAQETADLLAQPLRLGVQTLFDLHEHDRGNVAYLSQDAFRLSVRDFFEKPDQLVFGAETADQAYTRFYRAVHSILNQHIDQTVVVVTHGTVISLFVSRLTGSSGYELWSQLGLPSFVAMDLHSSTILVRGKVM